MQRAALLATALLLLSGLAQASLLEDALEPAGITYQHDAGVAGDAPDACTDVDRDRQLVLDDDALRAILVEVDDPSDAFAFNLTDGDVGKRVVVDLAKSIGLELYELSFDVLDAACQDSVFDPDARFYRPGGGDPAPAEPYAPGPSEAVVEGRINAEYTCDPSGWKFVANQMGGIDAPADVFAQWTDGTWDYVPLAKDTPATIAHYQTSDHLDHTVDRLLIVLPADYTGNFHIGSGPCDAADGGYVEPAPPSKTPASGEFTVVEAGLYVAVVRIEQGPIGTISGLAEDPPSGVPASCHQDICSLALTNVEYGLGSSEK